MKKTLLTLLIAAFAVSAWAQGTINFDNRVIPTRLKLIYAPDPGSPGTQQTGQSAGDTPAGATVYGGAPLSGAQYTAQLWAGAGGIADPNSLVLVAGSTTSFLDPQAGVFIEVDNLVIPGVGAGLPATFQIRVFDTTTGATFAAATTKGASALVQSPPLGGVDTDGTPFITPDTATPGGFVSFSLTGVVPEPSSFALAGLGAAAMLIFRRRK